VITNPLAGPDDAQRHNDVRMRTLATQTSVVMWHTAPDGSAVGDNPSWEAFTGQSHAEATGWGWLAAIDPAERDAVRAAWQAGVATRALVGLRYRLRRADGQLRDVEAQAVPVLDGDELREWVGICIDVTDRKRQREELEASEERLRLLDRLSEATRSVTEATAIMAITAQMLGEYLGVTRCAYADVELDNDRFTIRSDWSAPGVPSSAGVYSLDLFGPQATDNLRNGRKLVVNDVDRELGDEGGGRMFNAIGIKAIITAPLVKDDRLVAMMAVHSAAPRRWTEREIAIVGEVVERCWAHIERVRDAALLREQDRYKDEFLATLAHELRNRSRRCASRWRCCACRTTRRRRPAPRDRRAPGRPHGAAGRRPARPVAHQPRPDRAAPRARRARDVDGAGGRGGAARHRGGRPSLHAPAAAADLELDADPARIVQVIGNLPQQRDEVHAGRRRHPSRLPGSPATARRSRWSTTASASLPTSRAASSHVHAAAAQHRPRERAASASGSRWSSAWSRCTAGASAVRSDGLDAGTAFTIELPVAAAPAAAALGAGAGHRRNGDRVPHPRRRGQPGRPRGAGRVARDARLRGAIRRRRSDGAAGCRPVPAADRAARPRAARHGRLRVARALQAAPSQADAVIVALTGWGAERDRTLTRQAGFITT
jgi:PAS domain S-box-containing protein